MMENKFEQEIKEIGGQECKWYSLFYNFSTTFTHY